MNKIIINGKRYIKLGDLDHLCRSLCKDIYDGYERGKDGKIHLSETDMARTDAYHRIMHEIMYNEIQCAESPDEIREMHDRLRKEWMYDKFVIVGNDDGENVFFRKMCTCGTDEEHPVFTGKIRLARTYDDHYNATCFAAYLEQTYDLETKVEPLYLYAMTNEEAKSMLKAIFRDDAPDESGDDDE